MIDLNVYVAFTLTSVHGLQLSRVTDFFNVTSRYQNNSIYLPQNSKHKFAED